MLEQTVSKNRKSLLGFSSKRQTQTYIIAGNLDVTWRKTSSKN